MDELTILKIDLRGLVISYKLQMTIGRLEKDYIKMSGKPIPFTEQGFNSLENFLKSMTDTLQVFFFFFCAAGNY